MGVICKMGRHFIDVQAARECADKHRGGCGECEGTDLYWSFKNETPSANEQQPDVTKQDNTVLKPVHIDNQFQCPLHKNPQGFPCPRCCHSEATTEIREFLKATTWWFCKYPMIVNLRMLRPEDLMGGDDTK